MTTSMLAVVAPLNQMTIQMKLGREEPTGANYVFDRLAPELCVPHPGPYTRLSEMMGDGWVVTAMTEHPTLVALVVALRRG